MDKDKSNEKESEIEVSLPGAGGTEQTILEVFNSNLVNSSDDTTVNVSLSSSSSSSSPPLVENSKNIENDRNHQQNINESITNESQSVEHSSASVKNVDIVDTGGNINVLIQQKQFKSNNKDTKINVDTDSAINPEVLVTDTKFESDVRNSEKSTTTTKIQDSSNKEKEQQQNDNQINTKVLDIESHLIETFENYSVNESDQSGVSVNEVPPAQEELLKPSTIESDDSIKTVIEIEPRTPILHKTIKTNINVIPNLPKVEFNSSSNKNLTKNSESSNTSKSVSNEINSIDEVLNNDNITEQSKSQEKLIFEIEKLEDKVPVSPHIEEESLDKSNFNLKISEKIEEKESEKQIPNIASHIEEKTLEEKKNESINLKNLKEEKSQVNSQKSQKDLYSDLKSPALLLHLIESTFGKPSETEKEIQDKGKTEKQVTQPTLSEEKPEVSKSDKEATIETVQNTETIVPKEILKDTDENKVKSNQNLGINGLGVASPEEEEAKKSFLESIPQLEESPSSSAAANRYYQSLREYLDKKEASPPPVPIQTYRWEDLRRAKEKGGYPWTHLYKRPLGADEEPEIVLLLRKSQELRFPSESPRSLKKVRIHDQVLVKETERYISDLSDTEDVTETEDTKSAQSETTSLSESEDKPSKLNKIKGILKRNRPPKLNIQLTKENGEVNSNNKSENSPKRAKCCHPIMDKLKIMADKQLKKRHIKKIPLKKDERIILMEEQKILKLKLSPKAERSEIPHFIEKRDSDEILEDDKIEIVELDESPSKARKRREQLTLKEDSQSSSVLIPDEIIEIPQPMQVDEASKSENIIQPSIDSAVPEVTEEEIKAVKSSPPKKSPRKKKEHVYEDIDESLGSKIDEILEEAVVSVLKQSLITQDQFAVKDLEVQPKLEEMGSSEETEDRQVTHLAPISSIDSTSSEEEKKQHLAPLAEESDQGEQASVKEETLENLNIVEDNELNSTNEIKSVLKREPSPSTSDKKVTFSHVEDESEPHREDIELPEQFKPPPSRWSKMSDHEYEPIEAPSKEQAQPEPQQPQPEPQQSQPEPENEICEQPSIQPIPTVQVSEPMDVEREITTIIVTVKPDETIKPESDEVELTAEEFQRDIDDRYFSSFTTTPKTESRAESRTDNIHSSQVDSSAIEELPPKAENRRKSFMASAQDKGKKVQAGLKSQAVKIKSKIRGIKKPPTGSPKKERKRFKAPEFSKMKMPEMKFKGPDMSKFKAPEFKKIEFKRPEFTKFNKPDMSKFKMPEKLSSLKLKRSKSLKETETIITTETITESSNTTPKKTFEFSFGTYPRALRRKKEKKNDIPTSSETPPSFESTTIPRGARDKGPVGSKWIDKFSDISYGDSESGKYQRYESSEPESIEPRESSLERKIRENLDRVAKEDEEFETLQTAEQKQFAEFDEENRAIHEISKIRENEFKKRRPMVHQDSDLVSEESKEIGWTEKDIIRNKLLMQTNAVDNEKFAFEDGLTNTNLETQSSGSSSAFRQKGVIEEIDDDEFFLRKRGISQDNIEIRQYITTAIREGFDTPINALAKLGNSNESYPDEMVISNEQMEYGYDVPPPKPRRAKRFSNFDRNAGDSAEVSQEFDIEQKENYDDNISLPRTGSDYFKHLPPNRPLRKSKKQYSQDSQEVPDAEDIPYFDDEQMFFKRTGELNNLGSPQLIKYDNDIDIIDQIKRAEPPKAPKRRRKNQLSESTENDGYLNGFAGRSISNTYLPNDDQLEELVVYRTEHEYVIPLAQPEQFTPLPTPPTRSRSRSRITDDRTSLGVDSLDFHEDENNFKVQMKQNDGYAVVKKEPPPRPPAPLRRKRSTNSFDQRFATMPNIKNGSPVPQRPKRNYSTIGPARPARRKSSATSVDIQKDLNTSDATQYEELDIDIEDFEQMESQKNLQSGHIIRKMKDRPLPPPPRPPRENRKHKHINNDNDENDKGGGGEKIIADLTENGDYEIEKSFEKCIEVEVSTQTDPLPDDFVCEEFEITDDMKIIEPRRPKTLEDILKEEQEAEFERAKQLADEEYLSYGLQRFRESNQRSISERSRGSTAERSKHSRPTTPSAILIERRVPTPLPYLDQTLVEASLIVQPVDDDEIVEKIESEPAMSEQKSDRSEIKSEDLPDEEQIVTSDTGSHYQEEEERLRENLFYKLGLKKKEDKEYKSKYLDETNFSLEPSLEERTVSNQDQSILKQDERFEENVLQEETLSEPELPPQPPPRRRSSNALTTDQAPETTSEVLSSAPPTSNQLMPISEFSPAPVQAVTPNRLAVADLEVERLNVHALQAAQITVSELHGSLISADDLDCKSGNLVVRNLELPPGLIEEIVERVRSSERPQMQAQTQTTSVSEELKSPTTTEEPPARPPPPPQHQIFPSEYMQYSIPPPSFYQLRSPTDDDTMQPLQPHRRRRHYRRRDSSSDEESYRERRRSRQGNRSPDQTIAELSGQLMNACGTSVVRTMNSILNYLRASEKDGVSRNNISAAIVILILATLGFLLFGLSGKNIHHHHWDFFNLPGNDGRGSKT